MSSSKFEHGYRGAALFSLFLGSLVPGCSSYVNWIYPSVRDTGLSFNYIDTVLFTWTSNITDPWMNLWCAPNGSSPQSKDQAYHEQQPTNGTDPQSFPYSDYYNNGVCHMQLENSAEDDSEDTPPFRITSNNAASPQTWGPSTIGSQGRDSATTIRVSSSSTRTSSTATSTASSSSFASPAASSAINTSPTKTTAGPTPSAAPPSVSPPSPSKPLDAGAKAGISIGSIFSGVALVIAVLLCRILRSRKKTGRKLDRDASRLSWEHGFPNSHEVGEGAYYEINGISRPIELQGIPRAELGGAARVELGSVGER